MSSTIFQAGNNLKPYQGLKPLVVRTFAPPPTVGSGYEIILTAL
jgi:hypothetical protein